MIRKQDITETAERIKSYIHRTPVFKSNSLNNLTGASLFFKCENLQKVGAFKMRGATNAVLSLSPYKRNKGVATHSSGNHAQALALAAKLTNTKAYIVMPSNAPVVKVDAVKGYGAEITFCEPTLASREATLARIVEKTEAVFIPPYNDHRIICGQATAAKELIEQYKDLDYIFAPVGGGGLLSGTALAAHYFSPTTKVIGAEPEGANDAYLSFLEGKLIPSNNPQTIADGLLTSLGEINFEIIKKYVSEIGLVTDKQIIGAMRLIWERMKLVVEPSGAVSFALVLKKSNELEGKKIGIIISGGNINLSSLPF